MNTLRTLVTLALVASAVARFAHVETRHSHPAPKAHPVTVCQLGTSC